ncbi:glycosyltransferase [Tyzzerella sp. OttesenSCG-928-J15]|nr:glycosyltransferase [Tyzzerella sp. OttesenSCG-928-J15]
MNNQLPEKTIGGQITELLETIVEVVYDIAYKHQDDYIEQLNLSVEGLVRLNDFIKIHCSQSKYGADISFNAIKSIQKVIELVNNGELDTAIDRLSWETIPILLHLQNDLNYWLMLHNNETAASDTLKRQLEAVEKYKNEIDEIMAYPYPFEVSIVVLIYNQLEYTKLCLDSIYRYTDLEGMNVEIITIDNGSDEETTAYINSLPHKKKIRLEKNVSPIASYIGFYASEGKYNAYFNNDIIATTKWLDNLLTVIKSDKMIAVVAPVLNNISNDQKISVDYTNPLVDQSEMQAFAEGMNISDQTKWEDRARILPSIDIAVTQLLLMVPCDARYYYGFYSDDDTATVYRRAGLRQVLAKDTFMHHFGAVTLHEDNELNMKYAVMRGAFFNKWKVDAWDGMNINSYVISVALNNIKSTSVKMLVVDSDLGSTALYIRNILRQSGVKTTKMDAIVTDLRYLDDHIGLFDHCDYCESGRLLDALKADTENNYDLIVFHRSIEEYLSYDWKNILHALKEKCNKSGSIIFGVNNPQYVDNVISLANNRFESFVGVPPIKLYTSVIGLKQSIVAEGYDVTVTGFKGDNISSSNIKKVENLTENEDSSMLTMSNFVFELRIL